MATNHQQTSKLKHKFDLFRFQVNIQATSKTRFLHKTCTFSILATYIYIYIWFAFSPRLLHEWCWWSLNGVVSWSQNPAGWFSTRTLATRFQSQRLGLSENCAVSHNPLVYQSPISQLGWSIGGYTPFSDTANWRQGLVKKLAEKLKPKNYMLTK